MPSDAALAQASAALADVISHLTPEEAALVAEAQFQVADDPTPEQRGDFPDGGWLLGLYESPPPRVTVFENQAAQAAAAGKVGPDPISDIVRHEVGHVVGYMHDDPVGAGNMHCGCLPPGAGIPCDCGAMFVQ